MSAVSSAQGFEGCADRKDRVPVFLMVTEGLRVGGLGFPFFGAGDPPPPPAGSFARAELGSGTPEERALGGAAAGDGGGDGAPCHRPTSGGGGGGRGSSQNGHGSKSKWYFQ